MRNRLVVFIVVLAVEVGLIFGLLFGTHWSDQRATPDSFGVPLDAAGQDDFIIAVAEAYANDGKLELAKDRLARLHSENVLARVENLAGDYVPQFDLVSERLATLAVALGSTNPTIIVLSVPEAPTSIQVSYGPPTPAPLAAREGPVPAPTRELLAASALQGETARAPDEAAALAPPTNHLTTLGVGMPSGPAVLPTPIPESAQDAAQAPPPGIQGKIKAPQINPPSALVQAAPAKRPIVAWIPVKLPDYVGAPNGSIPLTARPGKCTPASQMPAEVDHSIMLCPQQTYAPFSVKGENITVYGDKTALIRGKPRGFGIVVSGTNITLFNVNVAGETDPGDLNSWLCMYDTCSFKTWTGRGGAAYGGGILLDHTTHAAVISATVSSGTIGIASLGGSGNLLVNNHLANLNGWGLFLALTRENYLVGNTLENINRACQDPEGNYVQSGCESSAMAGIRAEANLIVNNHCEHGANCYYLPGNGGFSSNNNKLFNNYCAAAGNNCFEVTFSTGNKFDYNVGEPDPQHPEDKCDYPFWISGSVVQFGPHNNWNCKHDGEQALNDSRSGTEVTTGIEW